MWGQYSSKKPKDPKEKLKKLQKQGKNPEPIIVKGRNLAKNWWGRSWNKNLESYADYSNRIARGRSYLRNGSVLDLKISEGVVCALVQGTRSRPYDVIVKIEPLSEKRWKNIVKQCGRRLENLEQLAAGEFPKELEILFHDREKGLFPSPKEISFGCSCPDYAYMCKHVAAVLYGIGAKLDLAPDLFFVLRGIDLSEILKRSLNDKLELMLKNAGKVTDRVMTDVDVEELFGQ